MHPFIIFILKSSISLAVFYLVFIAGLKKTNNFNVIRMFLTGTLIISIGLPLIPITYNVLIANPETQIEVLQGNNGLLSIPILNETPDEAENAWSNYLIAAYAVGLILLLTRLVFQLMGLFQVIRRHKIKREGNMKIVVNNYYLNSFSFFNYFFIHKKYIESPDYPFIIAHEKVHIHQRHWIDLLLVELCVIVYWVNPLVWLYARAIRQNHEYLADQGVVRKGNSLARYQAVILNQLMGGSVVRLTNSLNFSINTKRMNMMKIKVNPKKGVLRTLWAVPAVALMMLAFARPEYVKSSTEIQSSAAMITTPKVDRQFTLKGKVMDESGMSLPGTNIVIEGTMLGTVADRNGDFSINIGAEDEIVVSFVGYVTEKKGIVSFEAQDEGIYQTEIKMKRGRLSLDIESLLESGAKVSPPSPPPPSRDNNTQDVKKGEEVYVVVEDIPQYPGGIPALADYLENQVTYFRQSHNLHGNVVIGYTINTKGKVTNIQVLEKDSEGVAKASIAIVSGFETWEPAAQRGKNVSVDYALRFSF